MGTNKPKSKKRVKNSSQTEKRMLTFDEVARYVGLSPQTVRNKFYQGQFPIPAKKIFSKTLFDRKEVDAYLVSERKLIIELFRSVTGLLFMKNFQSRLFLLVFLLAN